MRIHAEARVGISLLEAVVAIAIVGITSVSALEAVGGDLRTAERSRHAMEAQALATTRLDFLQLYGYNQIQALPDSVKRGTFAAPLDDYTWTTSAAPISDQPGLFDVRVAINWTDGSYAVKTYVFRSPPIFAGR